MSAGMVNLVSIESKTGCVLTFYPEHLRAARACARVASPTQFRGEAFVLSESSSLPEAAATASTEALKAASLAFDGWLVGTGPGSGMSLQFLISGVLYISIVSLAWFIPAVRNVETLLPDHDQLKKVEEAPAAA